MQPAAAAQGDLRLSSSLKGFSFHHQEQNVQRTLQLPEQDQALRPPQIPGLGRCAGQGGLDLAGGGGGFWDLPKGRWRWLIWEVQNWGPGGTKATSAKLQAKSPPQNHPKPLRKDPSRPPKPPGHEACPAMAARASTGPAWLQRSTILPIAQHGALAMSDPTAARRVKKIKTRTQEQQLFKSYCPAARSPCPGAL